MTLMHAKFHTKIGQFDVFFTHLQIITFFTDQNYPLVIAPFFYIV